MVFATVRFATRQVVAAGLIAGLIFAAFEMTAAALMGGVDAFFMPLRMIGAIVLGPAALEPSYPLMQAAITGLVIHAILSVLFALLFSAMAPRLIWLRSLIAAGVAFGVVLWVVNFYVIASLAGWTWFPEQSNTIVQFFAHAFFYGCPLGWYLGESHRVRVSSTV